MGLTGALSNQSLGDVLKRLAARDWHQARQPRKATVGWSDGRRKFGVVSGAIVQVLSDANSDLRVRDIRTGVELLLGEEVSPSSIKSYLNKGCARDKPVFERLGWGRYRVIP